MSNESGNLIDLSNEENSETKLNDEENGIPPNIQNPFKQVISLISDMDIGEQFEDSCGSSCNNPFDSVQQIANRADDPFESVYMEVTNNTQHSQSSESDIKTDNLLSLSDGNITINNEDKIHSAPILAPDDNSYQESVRKFRRSLAEIATSCTTLINLESPPVLYSFKSSPETIDSATSGDSDGFITKVTNRKKIDSHKRLLKLSLSNSTSNTPVSRRLTDITSESPMFKESADGEGTQKTRHEFEQYSKSFNDSSEDLALTKPNWLDSETDIDKDLEMLTIPMLNEIDSSLPLTIDKPRNEKYNSSTTNLDFESFRERVQKHRKEANNLEISNLIQNLKLVIEENPNEQKKQEAISLLENLSTVLSETNDATKDIDSKENSATPQPIVRQGTFDMDLKENEEHCDQKRIEDLKEHTNVSETSCATHSTHSVHSERSIATDECEIIISSASPDKKYEEEYHGPTNYQTQQIKTPEQCNIVNHIDKLFGGELYDINVVQNINEVVSSCATGNPTYIVVVNTPRPPPMLQGSVSNLGCTQNSNDEPPDLEKCKEFRRRSQSLSVRDNSHLQKPATLEVPKLAMNEKSGFKTPSRIVLRRNSFCNAITNNSLSSTNATNANRTSSSFSAFPNKNIRHSITLTPRDRKNASIGINPSSFKTAFNAKKLKFKSSTESIFTSSGPMKATLPLRKVTSKILTTEKSPTAVTKGGSIIATSTPIYLNNSYQASSNSQRKFYTTPTMDPSPVKRTEVKSSAPKTRYSFALTPMSEKLGVVNHLKRRTISELRDKSQKNSISSSSTSDINTTKDHSSLVGATLSGVSKQNTRTVKLPQNFSRSLSKLTPSGTTKANTRSTMPTKTSGLSTVVHKNKENKQP